MSSLSQVEKQRKPRRGLKLSTLYVSNLVVVGRKAEKTPQGIETFSVKVNTPLATTVEKQRKPRRGLKQHSGRLPVFARKVEKQRKPRRGLKLVE